MIYAVVDGVKKHIKDAERGEIGLDPFNTEYRVIACKGTEREYWRHEGTPPDYPIGYENMTPWHYAWQFGIKAEYCEVVLGQNHEHRSDIFTPMEAIEIQNSPIALDALIERTNFYSELTGKRVVWIVNAYRDFCKGRVHVVNSDDDTNRHRLIWSRMRAWIRYLIINPETYVYLDISPRSTKLIRAWVYGDEKWGAWVNKVDFYKEHLAEYSFDNAQEFMDRFKSLKASDYF